MTLQLKTLSQDLSNIVNNVDFSGVEEATQTAIDQFNASKKTVLGNTVGEIKGGIESLTQDVDDELDKAEAQLNASVTRVTKDVPGVSDQLIGDTGGSSGDIEKITGTSGSGGNGFLQEIVGAGTPESLRASLTSVDGINPESISSALQEVVQDGLEDIVAFSTSIVPFKEISSAVTSFSSQIDDLIGTNSAIFLEDFGEKLEKNFENDLIGILDEIPTPESISIAFREVALGNYDDGFDEVRKYVDLPENYDFITSTLPRSEWPADILEAEARLESAEQEFNELNTELSTYADPYDPISRAAGFNTLPVNEIGSSPTQSSSPSRSTTFRGTTSDNTSWSFDYVNSVDELEAMFRQVSRPAGQEIAGTVIHWSATFLDQDVDAEWIHGVHRSIGYSGIGYHLVIKRDGTIQKGRPLSQRGAHDSNNNETFLGICFVGGINETSNRARKPYWRHASSESLTPAQFNAYDKLMGAFHRVFPYAQVAGHYMTSEEGKVDPGFDVVSYSRSKFNHTNVIPENDPIWKSPTDITIDTISQYSADATS